MKKLLLICIFSLVFSNLFSQSNLLTVAEKSNFKSTSSYEEVISFIKTLDESSDIMKTEWIAKSTEGRNIPLIIIANPMINNLVNLKQDKRIVVYIQSNIHPGEVEGKESSQMIARYLVNNPNSEILQNCIVLINPILNADGNEKISTNNRTNQNGPFEGVGVRYNGQQLDLNRDAMKLESPEIRGLVANVLNKYDPSILVDCHTTNGSYHEEPVTFTWMMNPNGDRSLINFMRDDMMPKVHNTLFNNYGVENVFYGEFIDRLNIDKGWISYACEPRYVVNYVGLRNRLAILNENYVYADYETRVKGSYKLLLSILDYASENKVKIKNLIKEADEKTINRGLNLSITDSFAIEYQGVPTPEKITIKAFEADTIPGARGYWRFKKSDRRRTVTIDYIADYFPIKNVKFPYAYILSIPDEKVLENLENHGIKIERLKNNVKLEVERFKISNIKPSHRLNQGHYTNIVNGEFIVEEKEFPKGTVVVKTSQPLASLAAYLLEPQSDDGLLKWNYFDKYLVPQWGGDYFPYPVYRLMNKVDL
jgi:hypothetical protein